MFKKLISFFDPNIYDEELKKYIKQYGKLNNLFGLSIFISIISIVLVFFIYIGSENQKPVKFYTINLKNNDIQRLIVYKSPILTTNNISNWVENAVKQIFSLNFLNYEEKLKQSKIFFSNSGYKVFYSFFKESPILNEVINKKLDMSLVPISSPKVINNYDGPNGHIWIVEIPVIINFSGANPLLSKKYIMSVNIESADPSVYQNGIYITSIRLN